MFDWDWTLWALAASGFLSATLLPANSELALIAYLNTDTPRVLPAIFSITCGNTLGGISSVWIGRWLPQHRLSISPRVHRWIHRYGAPILLLSWLPVVGDALCVAAGYWRMPWLATLFFLTVGKFLRYAVLTWPFWP